MAAKTKILGKYTPTQWRGFMAAGKFPSAAIDALHNDLASELLDAWLESHGCDDEVWLDRINQCAAHYLDDYNEEDDDEPE